MHVHVLTVSSSRCSWCLWSVLRWGAGPGSESHAGQSPMIWDGLWNQALTAVLVWSGDVPGNLEKQSTINYVHC